MKILILVLFVSMNATAAPIRPEPLKVRPIPKVVKPLPPYRHHVAVPQFPRVQRVTVIRSPSGSRTPLQRKLQGK